MVGIDKDHIDQLQSVSWSAHGLNDAATAPRHFSPPPSTSPEKAELAKQLKRYVPPSSRLKFCLKCDKYPKGFRGEHELRRHEVRVHEQIRKAWVCVDISSDGKFLANCRSCAGGKRYNAYYNAAAHLRRSHFNPKGRRKDPSLKDANVQPPMEVLKLWMKEVTEVVPDEPIWADFDDGETQQSDFEHAEYEIREITEVPNEFCLYPLDGSIQ